MSNRLLIERISDDKVQTLGRMYVLDRDNAVKYDCNTLELAWDNNTRKKSCIPEGNYEVVKRWSPKFKYHFHITDVKDRTFILIHSGNYHTQILGCVLVGSDLRDINGDGRLDVVNSKNTLADLLGLLPQKFTLKIVSV
jgi:hypothetical protein